MLNKTSLKFIAGFVVIIAASLASLYFLQTYFNPKRQAERRYAELQKQYADDVYGGKTPGETLQLFIAALKAGDADLASKYFLPENRDKIKADFLAAKSAGTLNVLANKIQHVRQTHANSESVQYELSGAGGGAPIALTLGKNKNGVWKISEI